MYEQYSVRSSCSLFFEFGKTNLFFLQGAQGLRILAFPCNQFGGQEPGSSEDIKNFVKQYNVTFDMFEKIDVNGSKEHPLFTYLKNKQAGFMMK